MQNRRALIALALAGLAWGLTVPMTKVALGWLDPAWTTVVRFGLAAPVLAWIAGPPCAARRRPRRRLGRRRLRPRDRAPERRHRAHERHPRRRHPRRRPGARRAHGGRRRAGSRGPGARGSGSPPRWAASPWSPARAVTPRLGRRADVRLGRLSRRDDRRPGAAAGRPRPGRRDRGADGRGRLAALPLALLAGAPPSALPERARRSRSSAWSRSAR